MKLTEEGALVNQDLGLGSCLEVLRLQIRNEVAVGHLDAALELSAQAIDVAERLDDRERLDIECCNRAGILVGLGRGDEVIVELRRLLMCASSAHLQYLAAYNVAACYEWRQEIEDSRFYGRLALDHAARSGEPASQAMAHYQLARLHTANSAFDEASIGFEKALELLPGDRLLERAIMLSSLGCCLAMHGRLRGAFLNLSRSLRLLRRLKSRARQRLPHLGLSYAYLEIGRYDRARSHARRALELSEGENDGEDYAKHLLYLLGESEKMLANPVAAYEHFQELQRTFYPDQPGIVDVLMVTNVRKLIHFMV